MEGIYIKGYIWDADGMKEMDIKPRTWSLPLYLCRLHRKYVLPGGSGRENISASGVRSHLAQPGWLWLAGQQDHWVGVLNLTIAYSATVINS
jgi:hypothetical protein